VALGKSSNLYSLAVLLIIPSKSAIATKYAQRHLKKKPEASIFWIQSSSAASFNQSYSEVANTLKLAGRDDYKANVLKLVYEHLSNEQNGPWFMVLDGVDDRALLSMEYARRNDSGHDRPLSSFLPAGSHGLILLTSRDREVAESLTGSTSSTITIHALDEVDSTTLLLEQSEDKVSPPEDAKRLASCLDNHPLALTQAAAYISKRLPEKNITNYLSSYQKPKSMKYQHVGSDSFIQAVSATWKLAFDRIRKKHLDSFELLALMSVFHFDGIPDFLFAERRKSYEKASSDFEKHVIGPLIEYSLITRDGNRFSMHSLAHRLTRSWLQANHSSHQRVREALAAIAENFPDLSVNPDRWSECQLLLPHAESALSTESGPENISQGKQRGKLLYDIGYFKYISGDYASALRIFVSAKQIHSDFLKPDDEQIEKARKMIIKLQNLLPGPLKKSRAKNSRRTTSNKVLSKKATSNLPRPTHRRQTKQRQQPPSNLLSPQNMILTTLCISMTLTVAFTFKLKVQLGENEEGEEEQDSRLQTLESWLQEVYEGLESNRERKGEDKEQEEKGLENRSGGWWKWAGNGMYTLAGVALSLLLLGERGK
jgi:hypothetical protein